MDKKRMVIINPITPNEFFTIFICNGVNLLDDKSKKITANDQQTAVSKAYISPMAIFNYIHIVFLKKKPL